MWPRFMYMFVVCIVMALDMLLLMPCHNFSYGVSMPFQIFNAVWVSFPSRHILLPIFCLLIFIHCAFQRCNRRVRLRAMLIGLEFIPGPVGDLVCEDGEDKDLAYRAGKRLVELRHWARLLRRIASRLSHRTTTRQTNSSSRSPAQDAQPQSRIHRFGFRKSGITTSSSQGDARVSMRAFADRKSVV